MLSERKAERNHSAVLAVKVEIYAFTGTGGESIVSWFIDLVALLVDWSCLTVNLCVLHLHNPVTVWFSFADGHAGKYHVTITPMKCLSYCLWWCLTHQEGSPGLWSATDFHLRSPKTGHVKKFYLKLLGKKMICYAYWDQLLTLNTCHHITPHGRKFRLKYIQWQGFGHCWPPTSWTSSPGFFTIHTLVSQHTTDMSWESKYSYCLPHRKPNCQRKG